MFKLSFVFKLMAIVNVNGCGILVLSWVKSFSCFFCSLSFLFYFFFLLRTQVHFIKVMCNDERRKNCTYSLKAHTSSENTFKRTSNYNKNCNKNKQTHREIEWKKMQSCVQFISLFFISLFHLIGECHYSDFVAV